MNPFNALEEVIVGHFFPKLSWNDLLRCRRVSKLANMVTDNYIWSHVSLAPEMEVNETDKTTRDFLKIGLPTSKIFLNNSSSGETFFDLQADSISEFLSLYGSLITHVRVDQLSLYIRGKERAFFQALPNLMSLEVAKFGDDEEVNLDLLKFPESYPGLDRKAEIMESKYPSVFQNLKRLKIGVDRSEPARDIDCQTVLLHDFCFRLEHATMPFDTTRIVTQELIDRIRARNPQHTVNCMSLSKMFENLQRCLPKQRDLRCYDFEYYNYVPFNQSWQNFERTAAPVFIELCKLYDSMDIKMLNVNALWLQHLHNQSCFDVQFASTVLSLVNMHPAAQALDLINLEKIRVTSTAQSCIGPSCCLEGKEHWPLLKKLEITVDSKYMDKGELSVVQANGEIKRAVFLRPMTKSLYDIFFCEVVRPNLVELRLEFKPGGEDVIPRTEDIVTSCPNLKKLALVNWPGKNKALLKLWEGLRGLEEIHLESCKQLGNVAFVGVDKNAPVFFKLKSLKKLSLKGLEQMPKVTDLLFTMVLKDISLTHLVITSKTPVNQVTPAGIKSLLTGNLARSIEKFPFVGWSLQDCSQEEFVNLSKQFRSYNMI